MGTLTRSDLRHGDILLYTWKNHQSIYVRGIRVVTGSQFVHVAVVQEINGNLYVLEQQSERMHSLLDLYYAYDGEEIYAFRPGFKVPPFNPKYFERRNYGYSCVGDSLINHFMNRITFKHWKFRTPVRYLFNAVDIDCSVLIARVIDLAANAEWCYNNDVIEPDDVSNHPETFNLLGLMAW